MTRCAWSLPDPDDSSEAQCTEESTSDSVTAPGELKLLSLKLSLRCRDNRHLCQFFKLARNMGAYIRRVQLLYSWGTYKCIIIL